MVKILFLIQDEPKVQKVHVQRWPQFFSPKCKKSRHLLWFELGRFGTVGIFLLKLCCSGVGFGLHSSKFLIKKTISLSFIASIIIFKLRSFYCFCKSLSCCPFEKKTTWGLLFRCLVHILSMSKLLSSIFITSLSIPDAFDFY